MANFYDLNGKKLDLKKVRTKCRRCTGLGLIIDPITKRLQECPRCSRDEEK